MTTETRSIIKLIPLWLVLAASLLLTLWSIKQLATSIVKTAAGEYETTTVMGKGMEMGMGGYGPGGYGNYCLTMPMYPQLSSSMGPGAPAMTQEDKIALEKYSKEMERYNAEYSAACRTEMEKQEKLRQEGKAASWSDAVTVYAILSLLGIFTTAVTLMMVRKDEKIA